MGAIVAPQRDHPEPREVPPSTRSSFHSTICVLEGLLQHELVRGSRGEDGRWPLQVTHDDPYPRDLGEAPGRPSRWITLRALRVLRWYEGRQG